MKFSEAIAILEMDLESHDTDQGLASAYRRAMKKYHPDVTKLEPAFALEMSKLVNEAYAFLHQNMGKWSLKDKGSTNLADIMADVYSKICHLPSITIERLGVWLWVTIETPIEFKSNPGDSLETIMKKRAGLKAFRKNLGSQLSTHSFQYAPKKMKWSWHNVGDGPKWRKRKAWDWDRIRTSFDHEELVTSPHRAVG